MNDFECMMALIRGFERKAEQALALMYDHTASDEERAIAHGQHTAWRTASKDVWHHVSISLADARTKMEAA